MSAPHVISDCLQFLCQKLSDLVEVWHSYNKKNIACFFLRHSVVSKSTRVTAQALYIYRRKG